MPAPPLSSPERRRDRRHRLVDIGYLVIIVAIRYYNDMLPQARNSPEMLLEMLLHLGRLSQGEDQASALSTADTTADSTVLSTAQWAALRYLDGANRFSRTPSAFAKFHGTTRGTASQTIRGLVKQGFLTQSRGAADRRCTQLDLTRKARLARRRDPFHALVRAADDLPLAARRQFANTLEHMLCRVAREKGADPFGCCTSCTHLENGEPGPVQSAACACAVTGNAVEIEDMELLCMNFQPAGAAPPAASP